MQKNEDLREIRTKFRPKVSATGQLRDTSSIAGTSSTARRHGCCQVSAITLLSARRSYEQSPMSMRNEARLTRMTATKSHSNEVRRKQDLKPSRLREEKTGTNRSRHPIPCPTKANMGPARCTRSHSRPVREIHRLTAPRGTPNNEDWRWQYPPASLCPPAAAGAHVGRNFYATWRSGEGNHDAVTAGSGCDALRSDVHRNDGNTNDDNAWRTLTAPTLARVATTAGSMALAVTALNTGEDGEVVAETVTARAPRSIACSVPRRSPFFDRVHFPWG